MRFVLDNLVVMRWFTPSGKQSDWHYVERVLESMKEASRFNGVSNTFKRPL